VYATTSKYCGGVVCVDVININTGVYSRQWQSDRSAVVCMTLGSAATDCMRGKRFTTEVKLDGYRLQVRWQGKRICKRVCGRDLGANVVCM
jgi:hypothetical protein